MNNSSENSLWYLFVEGDINAFSTLFKTYYPQLHNYGLKISSNHMITEDCLQSFFVYLHEHKSSLGSIANIKSYLFVSFRRAILKKLKQERRYISYEEIFEASDIFEISPEDLCIEQEFIQIRSTALAALMNKLSVREREAIYLKYYSDLDTNAISEIMDISYQSTLNTIQKAFIKLRKQAEKETILSVLNAK